MLDFVLFVCAIALGMLAIQIPYVSKNPNLISTICWAIGLYYALYHKN